MSHDLEAHPRTAAAQANGDSSAETHAQPDVLAAVPDVARRRSARRRRAAVGQRGTVLRVALIAAALVMLGVLAATPKWTTGLDTATTQWFIEHRSADATELASIITSLGSTASVAALALLLALVVGRQRRNIAAPALVLGIVTTAVVASTITKLIVARARPPLSARLVPETSYAFPSGHVTAVTALAGAVVLAYATRSGSPSRHYRVAAVVTLSVSVIAAVAATRLYLGVHWLSDVVAGAILGTAVTCAAAIWVYWSQTTRALFAGIGAAVDDAAAPVAGRHPHTIGRTQELAVAVDPTVAPDSPPQR
ncbi:phosphatase PAP2 family protein [Nocardia rhamnosiphila]